MSENRLALIMLVVTLVFLVGVGILVVWIEC